MSKRLIISLVLSLVFIGYASAGIIYVDATDGDAGNTALAAGGLFTADDPGTTGSGADGLWRKRAFSNGGTIYEAGGDWGGNNTEDCPRLATMVAVPEGDYKVYAYMITAGDAQWLMAASLENSEGDLPLYLCNDPNGAATLAVAEDFEEPVPIVTEADRTLWQIYLGTTGVTNVITVYIDDYADRDPTNGGNLRTWYDGIGYEAVAEPKPECKPSQPFSLGATEDITLGNDASLGPDSSSNGSGLDARDIPDRRRVVLISYDISTLKATGGIFTNVSLSCFSHDQDDEASVYGIIEDLDVLEVESLTWNTAPGVQNDPAPVLGDPVALEIADLTDVLLTFTPPAEVGVRFSTDTSAALADFLNSDADGIVTFLLTASAVDTQAIVRSREHSAGGTLLEGDIVMPAEAIDPGTEGLIADYPMENDVNDVSGNELHGTFMGDPNMGGPTFVAGMEGMALDLDGVDDYVDCGYDPLFDVNSNEITVSAWVTIRSNANQWAAIAAKGEYAWRLGNASWDPRFHFGITIWSAPDTASLDGVTAVAYDEWHHVAGVFDGANIMVYLDGALDVSTPTTEPIGVNDKNMLIGNNPDDPVRYWDGLVDELKIYDRALSECELLYLAERPCIPVHSYTFEDGTANDSVGSADGTLVGGAVVADGALLTTAQDQWMEMPGDVIDINSFDAVTIEAWYTPTAGANTGWSMLAYLGGSSEPNIAGVGINGYFMTTARADDKSRAAISTGSNEPWADETGADGVEYDDGMLHHMVSTLDADEITLYIDGVLQARTPMDAHNSISDLDNDYALLAKGGYGGDPEWIGQIHEFNIYDCVLSPAEVADKYAAGLDE